jgi:hypothetical protein
MTRNVGRIDRGLRGVAALALLVGAAMGPWRAIVRAGLILGSVYFAFSAVAGLCIGYACLRVSTRTREPGPR